MSSNYGKSLAVGPVIGLRQPASAGELIDMTSFDCRAVTRGLARDSVRLSMADLSGAATRGIVGRG